MKSQALSKIWDRLSWAFLIIFLACLPIGAVYGTVVRPLIEPPGPSSDDRACVLDGQTIRFIYRDEQQIVGDYYVSDAVGTAKVGDRGKIDIGTFLSLTPAGDNAWQAVFKNRLTNKTSTHILFACPEERGKTTPAPD